MPPIDKIVKATEALIEGLSKGAARTEPETAAATKLSQEFSQMTNREFTAQMPTAFQRLYPQLSATEQTELVEASKALTPKLIINDVKLPEYFAPGFDPKAFLAAKKALQEAGVQDVGPAASLSRLYGRGFTRFLDDMSSKGIKPKDAVTALPEPTAKDISEFAGYLTDKTRALPAGTELEHRLHHLKAIGDKWPELTPDMKQLGVDDLAFRVRTGMTREQFQVANPRPLTLSFDGKTTTDGFVSGWDYARINRFPAGQALISREGSNMDLQVLTVDPAFRRLGIARSIIGHLEQNAPHDVTNMRIMVRRDNLGAKTLYSELGFKPQDNAPLQTFVKPLRTK